VTRTRPPRDRDFVETREGFFFCLVGSVHPPDRYLAYLKYTPAAAGKWVRGAVAYRREFPYYHVRNVQETVDRLAQSHPHYVWRDPASGLRFTFVPHDRIVHHYRPEARLREILAAPTDSLEAEVRELVGALSATSGVPAAAFGITGSILLGLHNPAFSDIDLVVYGRAAAGRVRAAVATAGAALAPLPPDRRATWRRETAERFGLGVDDVAHLDARRWNYGLFRGRYVSIHPTPAPAEIVEGYGDRRYAPRGPATIEARVIDVADAWFLPAAYRVADVIFRDGPPASVEEIVTFEALFAGIADPGDQMLAVGQLEVDPAGRGRLVVGSAGVEGGGLIRVLAAAPAAPEPDRD
jgi:uncharacterized protein